MREERMNGGSAQRTRLSSNSMDLRQNARSLYYIKIDVCVPLRMAPLRTAHAYAVPCHAMPCYIYILFNMPHNSLPPRMITTVSPLSLQYFRLFSFAIVVDYFAAIISPQILFGPLFFLWLRINALCIGSG